MKAAGTNLMKRLFQPSTFKGSANHTPAQGHKIRIVSYNILAEKYSSYNTYCPPQYLSWSHRCPRLLAELESYTPDVVCLQEVEHQVFTQQLQPWMQQRGYHSLFHPRTSTADPQATDDGVSLHFNAAVFSHIDSTGMRFAAADASAVLPAACCHTHEHNKFAERLQQRDEGCLLALLQHLPSQRQLLVASTHLFWNPFYPDVKVAQAALMCSSIGMFLQRHGATTADVPVAIGGDFNSLWQKYETDQWDQVQDGQPLTSGVYQLLQQGQLAPDHQDHPQARSCARWACSHSQQQQQQQQLQQAVAAGLNPQLYRHGMPASMDIDPLLLSSVDKANAASSAAAAVAGSNRTGSTADETLLDYTFTTAGLQLDSSYSMAHGREPPLTTRTKDWSGCLDYIWLSRQHWQVTATLAMPYTEPQHPAPPECVTDLGPCPNEHWPSDHLAVGCDAVLLPVKQAPS